MQSAIARGMTFVSDADARPPSAAHPAGHLWDNGDDPIEELRHVLNVRRIALSRLGPDKLRADEPLANVEQLLVPVYLHHRFQVDATAKLIGGVDYAYDFAGPARDAGPRRTGNRRRFVAMDSAPTVFRSSGCRAVSRQNVSGI